MNKLRRIENREIKRIIKKIKQKRSKKNGLKHYLRIKKLKKLKLMIKYKQKIKKNSHMFPGKFIFVIFHYF